MANKLWNTGVDGNGGLLPLSAVDPNWHLIQWPAGAKPQSPPNVYVLADQLSQTYYSTPPDSRWVWASANGFGDVTGHYVFQTRFYLEFNFSKIYSTIEASWGADNYGHITVNTVQLPPLSTSGAVSLPSGQVFSNFTQANQFSISNRTSNVFHLGWNTLEVTVFNEGTTPKQNPAGFKIGGAGISLSLRP
jgi:hypothetical protein